MLMILFSLVWENNQRKDEGERMPYLDCKIMLGKSFILGFVGLFLCQTIFCNGLHKDLEYFSSNGVQWGFISPALFR